MFLAVPLVAQIVCQQVGIAHRLGGVPSERGGFHFVHNTFGMMRAEMGLHFIAPREDDRLIGLQ